jgi:uracil phosphoribosyltransferase
VPGEFIPTKGDVTTIDHPLIRVKLTEMRDATTGSQQFRSRLAEVATLMVYEVTRSLETEARPVQTPLAVCEGAALKKPLVIAPILRAGLGMVEGILWLLPDVSVAHIGMYRNEETRRPESYYFKAPSNLGEAEVLLVDPMLATGWSATAAITQLKENGARWIRFVEQSPCRLLRDGFQESCHSGTKPAAEGESLRVAALIRGSAKNTQPAAACGTFNAYNILRISVD